MSEIIKIYPDIDIPDKLFNSITEGYYDTPDSLSSNSTPRIISSPNSNNVPRNSSPITNISIKRKELLRAQSMMQHKIRNSINNLNRKIKNKQHEIAELEQRKIRLIHEFNSGVLDINDRIRGLTPPDQKTTDNQNNIINTQIQPPTHCNIV